MRIFLLLVFGCLPFSLVEAEQSIHFALDRNCPVICDPKLDGRRGYAVDIVEAVFREAGTSVDVLLVPYARMGSMVKSGQVDAAIYLKIVAQKLEDFTVSKELIRLQPFAVVKRHNFSFTYRGHESLESPVLGVTPTILEDGWLAESMVERKLANGTMVRIAGTNPAPRILKLIVRGRLDVFLGEEDALKYYVEREQLRRLLVVQRIDSITPDTLVLLVHRDSPSSDEWINHFNSAMPRLRQDGTVQEILGRYSLSK